MIAWSYLTPGQHAMWLADHDPKSDVEYTIAARLLLPSYLTKGAIRDAARFVVDSHPQLGIRISIRSGIPMQSIRVARKVAIDEIDFSDRSDEEYRSGVQKYLEKPFLIDSGELFRVAVGLGPKGHREFILSWHHIVADGFSVVRLLQDFVTVIDGGTVPAEEDGGFPAFVTYQRDHTAGMSGREDLDYWRNQLRDAVPLHDLPTKRERSGAGDTVRSISLPTLHGPMRRYTPYEVLLSAFVVLLGNTVDREDISVAIPLRGRPADAYTNTVGTFVNTGIIRINRSAITSFLELLATVRIKIKEAVRHQLYPFQVLLEALHIETPPDHAPITDAYCGMFPIPRSLPEGYAVTMLQTPRGPWCVSLDLVPGNDGYSASIRCSDRCWEPVQVDSMAENLRRLLDLIMEDPGRPITELAGHAILKPVADDGKTDESSSPAGDPVVHRTYPTTATETVVAGIWRDVLGEEDVSVTHNFFGGGGHSLKATQIVARLSDRYRLDLPIDTIFRCPTIRELAHEIDRLRRLHGNDAPSLSPPVETIPEATEDDTFPLAYSQERMWFLNRLDPGSAAYNVGSAVVLRGSIDYAAMKETFRYLQRRHEILRTRYGLLQDRPFQIVESDRYSDLAIVDRTDDDGSEIEHIVETELLRPFNLATELPMRLVLYRRTDHEHILAVSIHHIAVDHWSIGILIEEATATYAAIRSGRAPTLPELPFQYRDYARRQRSSLENNRDETLRAREHWLTRLRDMEPLRLPYDHGRSLTRTDRAGLCRIPIAPGLRDDLLRYGTERQVTPFSVLLACFAVLLHRHSSQQDVAIGVPVANRNHLDEERLIGTFLNTVVFRTTVDPEEAFRDLLRTVFSRWGEDSQYHWYPFARLVEDLEPTRNIDRSPLVEVLFNYLDIARDGFALESIEKRTGLSAESLGIHALGVQFDLTVTVDLSYRNELVFMYNRDVFVAATAERLAEQYVRLVEQVIDSDEGPIRSLDVLGPDARTQILETWNRTDRVFNRPLVHEEIFRRDRCDKPAVIYEGRRTSYRELVGHARSIGLALASWGIGHGSVVAVYLGRTPRLIETLLGILAAGATYLPLDPMYPVQRLSHALDDSDADCIMVERALPFPPEFSRFPTILIDDIDLDAEGSLPSVTRDTIAYILYTSGSTGTPKGVEISHGALANFLYSMAEEPGFSDRDGILAITPVSFDISGLELFGPLLQGGRVHLLPDQSRTDPTAIVHHLADPDITMMQATPATWRMLLEVGWDGRLHRILCGGEAFPPELVEPLFHRCDELWNLYGPTETTIWSSLYRIPSPDARPLIGRPIANTRLHILDASMQPVPIGVHGELYIGGAGLSRGYHKSPERTAHAFVPDPFRPGDRLYRTGDVARYHDDGSIEHLGRIDSQVKIRGFRVELEEVEGTLVKAPGILRAVCAVRRGTHGDDQLVAYCVPANGTDTLIPGEISGVLAQTLPSYMIPSRYVLVHHIPMTPNGKIDRASLPEITDAIVAGEPPGTDTERRIAAIWSEILDSPVGDVEGDFFSLGGHSLSAVRMVARIHREMDVEIPLRTFFGDPTVRGVAEIVDRLRGQSEAAAGTPEETDVLFPMHRGTGRDPLFVVAGIHDEEDGMYRYLSTMIHHIGPDQPVYGLRPRGIVRAAPPYHSVRDMATEYLREIRAVQPRGPYAIAGECIGGVVAYELARQLHAAGETVSSLILMDTEYPRPLRQTAAALGNGIAAWIRRLFLLGVRSFRFLSGGMRDHAQLLKRVHRRYRWIRFRWFPDSPDDQERKRYLDVKARYAAIVRHYRIRRYDGSVALIISNEHTRYARTLGWNPNTRAGSRIGPRDITVLPVPGDHTTRLTVFGPETGRVIRGILDRSSDSSVEH